MFTGADDPEFRKHERKYQEPVSGRPGEQISSAGKATASRAVSGDVQGAWIVATSFNCGLSTIRPRAGATSCTNRLIFPE